MKQIIWKLYHILITINGIQYVLIIYRQQAAYYE